MNGCVAKPCHAAVCLRIVTAQLLMTRQHIMVCKFPHYHIDDSTECLVNFPMIFHKLNI